MSAVIRLIQSNQIDTSFKLNNNILNNPATRRTNG